ncbi:MAG: MFS transporter [Pseudomonadota bacterium]|nr:MFS transporter [Pseudomonadota bacterium]
MSGLKLFYFILFGQSISLLGSSLTGFALGVWVYQTSESVMEFTTILVASTLPGIVLGPFIGSWIDRLNRKALLVGAQSGSAVVIVALAVLYHFEMLHFGYIILLVALASVFATVLQVGFTSTVTLIVPTDDLNKANAALGMVLGVVQLAGPFLAGKALDTIGISTILLIDIVSFLFGLGTLVVASVPSIPRAVKEGTTTVWQEVKEGYLFLKSKPGVLGGLYLFTLIWFNVSAVQALITPLVLSYASPSEAGLIMSVAGIGALVGGALMMTWKGPERRMYGILGAALAIAVVLVLLPVYTSLVWIGGWAFLIMALAPVATVCSQTLWQRKVPVHFHGRAFSLRNTIMKAAQPAAFLSAGFLYQSVFEPLMKEGAVLANLFGPIWGIGEGRGIALLISLFGVLSIVMVLMAWGIPAIRLADTALPDENVNREPAVT